MAAFLALRALGGDLERRQLVIPECAEIGAKLLQRPAPGAIDAPATLATERDQTGVLEHPQVLRDRRPGDVKVLGDLPDRTLFVPHQTQDLPPAWLGYRPQGIVHLQLG